MDTDRQQDNDGSADNVVSVTKKRIQRPKVPVCLVTPDGKANTTRPPSL